MARYESSRYVDASAQELFEFLAQGGNLPRYFPRMTSATSAEANQARSRSAPAGLTPRRSPE